VCLALRDRPVIELEEMADELLAFHRSKKSCPSAGSETGTDPAAALDNRSLRVGRRTAESSSLSQTAGIRCGERYAILERMPGA
jgi:hypothetical protein